MRQLKDRSPTRQVRLKFRKGLDNLGELRSGLSTCVICDQNLLLAYDESSAVERLTWKNGKYKKHKTFELDAFFELPDGPEGEMDIEGLAVTDSRVFLGLRGPVLGGWAVVLEISVHEHAGWLLLDSRGTNAKPYRKHFVNLSGMSIRELNIEGGDLYLLAGPTMDLDGTISAWRVKGCFPERPVSVTRRPERLFDIVYGSMNAYGKDKAEGMAATAEGDFLIVYDSPIEKRLKKKRSVLADVFNGTGSWSLGPAALLLVLQTPQSLISSSTSSAAF